MKTRASILVAAVCSLAYYSYTERVAASDEAEPRRPRQASNLRQAESLIPLVLYRRVNTDN